MKSPPRLIVGLAGATFSLAAFFVLMQYFGLFDTDIRVNDPIYMAKMLIAMFFLPFAFFWIGLALSGYRAGLIAGISLAALYVLAFIAGPPSH